MSGQDWAKIFWGLYHLVGRDDVRVSAVLGANGLPLTQRHDHGGRNV